MLVYHDHIGVLSAWHEILNLDISAFVYLVTADISITITRSQAVARIADRIA